MSFAEILLIILFVIVIYRLLKPLRVFLEVTILKAMGRKPKWIDADVITYPVDKKD